MIVLICFEKLFINCDGESHIISNYNLHGSTFAMNSSGVLHETKQNLKNAIYLCILYIRRLPKVDFLAKISLSRSDNDFV